MDAAIGDAVLSQRPQVMDAVQRMRKKAHEYGYLESNGYARVVTYPGYIEILPVDPLPFTFRFTIRLWCFRGLWGMLLSAPPLLSDLRCTLASRS